MLLPRTSQYAVQALIYMATQPLGTPILNKDIAAKLNVPAPYLAKILQSLAKGNLLYSFRGRLGGFCLKEDGLKTSLMDIVLLLSPMQLMVTTMDHTRRVVLTILGWVGI